MEPVTISQLPATSQEVISRWAHLDAIGDHAYKLRSQAHTPAALAEALRLSPVYAYSNKADETVYFRGVFAATGEFVIGFACVAQGPVMVQDTVDFTLALLEAKATGNVRLPATELELRRSLGQGEWQQRRELTAPGITLLPLFYKTFDALHSPLGFDRARVNGVQAA